MEVIDVFKSVSGEVGTRIQQGSLCTFVRFAGCPVHCAYCDTKESWDGSSSSSIVPIDELVEYIVSLGNKNVIVTGGEPLLQPDIQKFLIALIASEITNIVIETSGIAVHVPLFRSSTNVSYSVDYKLPSAKTEYAELNKFPFHVLGNLDVIKFLIADGEDLDIAIGVCKKLNDSGFNSWRNPRYVFSPMNNENANQIIEVLEEQKIDGIINVQIHKVLNLA